MKENLPEISLEKALNHISEYYTELIRRESPLCNAVTFFLWGKPGIGKTQGICQLAERLEKDVGKKVCVTYIKLSDHGPTDLSGIMVWDNKKEKTKWLKPEMFDVNPSKEVINLFFLDEIPDAAVQVEKIANQIIDYKKVASHKFPANCLFIGAGNRNKDYCMTYTMPKSLANRMLHYNVQPDFEGWKKWAVNQGVHPYVLGYLSYDNSKLCVEEINPERVAFPSPRSWMALSDYMNIMHGKTVEELHYEISGLIGREYALEFENWCRIQSQLPKTEDIFNGNNPSYPRTADALCALISSMTIYVRRNRDDITLEQLQHACKYADRFTVDFKTMFFGNLSQIEELRVKVMLTKVGKFRKWLQKQ